MADKFIKNVNGVLTEAHPLTQSTGASDAGRIPALDAGGHLDPTLMPPGMGAEVQVLPASEDIAAGDFVNVWNDAGVTKARLADASSVGKEANGFVLAAIAAGASGTVYLDGTNNQVTGRTPGTTQFLSPTTPGKTTETAPTGAGQFVQRIGKSLSAAAIRFEPGDVIVLAGP